MFKKVTMKYNVVKEGELMTQEQIEMTSFNINAHAGNALDYFHKAIECAKKSDFDGAEQCMNEGKKCMTEAHKTQTQLLTQEANNEEIKISVILLHAQDHLMTTLNFERMAKEYIDLYKRMSKLEKKLGE